jgi:two-component system, chemotaxis family, chemotaxis protein CheY
MKYGIGVERGWVCDRARMTYSRGMSLTGKSKVKVPKAPPTVLVIEDEISVVSALREALEDRGYTVAVAHDGIAGIEAAQTRKPAAIILDLGLPKQNGLQFLERLRASKSMFSIPVIVLSNVESSVVMQKCEELGMKCYYVKTHTSIQKVIDTVIRTVPLS